MKKIYNEFTRPKFKGLTTKLPSIAKQQFKEECDINNIIKKISKTGMLPELIKTNPKYGDFSSPLDYQESLNLVIHAQNQFDALPSHLRERFHNDPTKLLEFVSNPNNNEEMIKLGLKEKPKRDDIITNPIVTSPESIKDSKKDTPL